MPISWKKHAMDMSICGHMPHIIIMKIAFEKNKAFVSINDTLIWYSK